MDMLLLRGIANLAGAIAVFIGAVAVYTGLLVRENPQFVLDDMDEDDRIFFDTSGESRDFVGTLGYAVCFAIAAVCLFAGFYALFWGLGLV
jgi:hypothetical protein